MQNTEPGSFVVVIFICLILLGGTLSEELGFSNISLFLFSSSSDPEVCVFEALKINFNE